MTHTVEEVTGTPALTYRAWVSDHAADFRNRATEETAEPPTVVGHLAAEEHERFGRSQSAGEEFSQTCCCRARRSWGVNSARQKAR
ncbi:hypothetical protein Scel_85250 [Streptomyces cellostaticus]|nr:hypothetical protein Scel_85250 [Streptomyces cellostaticus]